MKRFMMPGLHDAVQINTFPVYVHGILKKLTDYSQYTVHHILGKLSLLSLDLTNHQGNDWQLNIYPFVQKVTSCPVCLCWLSELCCIN